MGHTRPVMGLLYLYCHYRVSEVSHSCHRTSLQFMYTGFLPTSHFNNHTLLGPSAYSNPIADCIPEQQHIHKHSLWECNTNNCMYIYYYYYLHSTHCFSFHERPATISYPLHYLPTISVNVLTNCTGSAFTDNFPS